MQFFFQDLEKNMKQEEDGRFKGSFVSSMSLKDIWGTKKSKFDSTKITIKFLLKEEIMGSVIFSLKEVEESLKDEQIPFGYHFCFHLDERKVIFLQFKSFIAIEGSVIIS